MLLGGGLIVLGLGAFLAWGALAPLQSAAIAPGTVIVEGNRKAVQHLEGGIVKAIHVREGDQVAAGQPLYTLDDTLARTRLEQFDIQLVNAIARRDRLLAERRSQAEIAFSRVLLDRIDDDIVREAIVLQTDFRAARLGSIDGQRQVLQQQILQLEQEIEGLQARIASDQAQARLVDEQIASNSTLLEKGLVRRSQMAALERDRAALRGRIGENRADIARAEQRIAETRLSILNVETDFKTGVVQELQTVQQEITQLQQAIAQARDVVDRTILRATQSGRVVNMRANSVGGVIGSQEVLLEIVPDRTDLIVDAHVRPEDIDVVHQDLLAEVRLTAYNARRTAPIRGTVLSVSADSITDERTGLSSYRAKVALDPEDLAKQPDIALYPGMPAEVMILLGERTAFDYLAGPILSSLNRSFREQ